MTPPPGCTSESEPFELLKTLGSGGFTTTYQARVLDEDLARDWGCDIVAIMVPLGKKQERILTKQVEMNGLPHMRLREIQSANLVRYLGFCVFRGQIVMAKQYVPGGSLRGMIGSVGAQKPLPLDQAVEIAEGTLAGLAAIHRGHFLHRDIKPENILMDGRVPKIEPGFLWIRDSDEQASLAGTLFYMSPELLDMERASFRSDIWSLGVTLYEMVTGVIPFGDLHTPMSVILDNIRRAEIRPPRELRPDIPEELDRIIMKALERPPERRFRTGDEMLKDLRAWRYGTISMVSGEPRGNRSGTVIGEAARMGKALGIDLGATNTRMAIADGSGPRVLDSREGMPRIRSVVSLKRQSGSEGACGGEGPQLLVGDHAWDNAALAPRDTILSIRCLIGREGTDPEVQRIREWAQFKVVAPSEGAKGGVRVVVGDTDYSPVDISAMILRKAKDDAELQLGEEVTHAVITVPAYFSRVQREATRIAGLKAGLKVTRILDEPAAVAVAFDIGAHDDMPRTVLVYDLGGSSLDVSVLVVAGNDIWPLSLEGDVRLGGDDLDQVLVNRVLRKLREECRVDPTSNRRFMGELRRAARTVKERLSTDTSASLLMIGMLQDEDGHPVDVDLDITREQFARMILPLIADHRTCACGAANDPEDDRCGECGASLAASPVVDGRALGIVKGALANANLTPEHVDHVLMVGQSSAVPLVQRSLEEYFGAEKVLRRAHPEWTVAEGAAIVARRLRGSQVCVAPRPTDRTKECGFVNEADATRCAQCGASLIPEEDADSATPDEGAEEGDMKIVRRAPMN